MKVQCQHYFFMIKLNHTCFDKLVLTNKTHLDFMMSSTWKKEVQYCPTAQMAHCIVVVCHYVKRSCDKYKAITVLCNFVIHSDASLTHR